MKTMDYYSPEDLRETSQRLHVRVKIESYSGVLQAPENAHATLTDISLGGIGFVTKEALKAPEKNVYISFTIPDVTGAPFVFHVKGEIIHSTFVKGHEGYLNGFEYDHLTSTQRDVLKHYILEIIEKDSKIS
jgi:c-di-GMP-binding flagellar brake protein YcgR